MAVVRYRCDTCDREIDLIRAPQGLETFGRCTITDGCRGKLHQLELFATRLISRLPPDVDGLDNWVARKVLFKHEQTISSSEWAIEHNLGTSPSVQVHITNNAGEFEEITPLSVSIVDRNNVLVTFSEPRKGIAQCIAVSTDVTVDPIVVVDTGTIDQLTVGSQLLVMPLGTASVSDIDTVFLSSTTGEEIGRIALTDVTPMATTYKVLYKGKQYQYFYASIGTTGQLSTIPNGSPFYFENNIGGDKDVFFLLSKLPHDDLDLVQLNQVLELSAISTGSSLYTEGELYMNDSLYRDIYPPFRRFTL